MEEHWERVSLRQESLATHLNLMKTQAYPGRTQAREDQRNPTLSPLADFYAQCEQ